MAIAKPWYEGVVLSHFSTEGHVVDGQKPMAAPMLNKLVREIYHGFEGVVVAQTEHLHGCDHVLIEPTGLLKDKTVPQAHSYDVHRVAEIGEGPKRSMPFSHPTIPLGATVKHKLNGLEGIVSSRTAWVGHTARIEVEPIGRDDKGELMETIGFDEDMLEIVNIEPPKYAPTKEPDKKAKKPGGPRPNATWQS